MIRLIIVLTGALVAICADPLLALPRVGDVYEIAMVRDSSEQGGDESSSSAHDKDTISERVIAVRPDGLELEYDLPREATAQDRKTNWQFPARLLRPRDGRVQLLNEPELKARLDRWLKEAKISREACGHWIFTWNAFRIECDPQSVINTIDAFEVAVPNLRDGAAYQEAGALGPVPLKKQASGAGGATYTAELKVDPDAVRKAQAESDVVVGEIMRKPVTLEEALRARAKTTVSGTVVVTFDVDPTGNVRRKTAVTQVDLKDADGSEKSRTSTQTIDRTLISSPSR
jgi:hypothetical protein